MSAQLILLGVMALPGGTPSQAALDVLQGRVERSISLNPSVDWESQMYGPSGFRRSRIVSLKSGDSGPSFILGSFAAFRGDGRQPVFEAQLLVERDSCFLRDSRITWREGGDSIPDWVAPLSDGGEWNFARQSQTSQVSPVRLTVRSGAKEDKTLQLVHEVAAARESFAFPVRSALLSLACAYFGERLSEQLRVHRDLHIEYGGQVWFLGQVSSVPALPRCQVRSSPFSHRVETVPESSSSSVSLPAVHRSESGNNWTPNICLDWFSQHFNSFTRPLQKDTFVILRRDRRWVWIDPGRGRGLQVGDRLVSQGQAYLHVIRIDRSPDSLESVIGFIRSEDAQKPLQVGDQIQLDLRDFRLEPPRSD